MFLSCSHRLVASTLPVTHSLLASAGSTDICWKIRAVYTYEVKSGSDQGPESIEFPNKPQLARLTIERVVAAKLLFGWITGDEVYGGDRRLRI